MLWEPSRESVQGFIKTLLSIPISVGARQGVIDRSSSRKSKINHVDEKLAFYKRFIDLVFKSLDRLDDAGKFARLLFKEICSLGVFPDEKDVEPTNTRAERASRFGALWRKRGKGTQNKKGNRWMERILSLKRTCRISPMTTFHILAEAVDSFLKKQKPNIKWTAQV